LVSIDGCEDSIMVDDAITPLNLPITLIKEEKLEKASLNVNVSQWLHDKEPFEKVVCTQVDRSAWDHRLFPNPHALAIYL
jgi:hypothetical protein